jgi:2-keto-4-pentenoate hydratase/2-oxohepta-3-ene-1,7-dioic acid hydratase in catechol pathway
MHIARYALGADIHYGIVEGDALRRLAGSPFDSLETSGETDPLRGARLLCPVEAPRIFGAGLNYVSHIEESGAATPEIPMLFMKPDTAAIGPNEPIVYPREGKHVDFEGELAVVIGKRARRVPEAEALGVVLGYSCANDLSERVIQFKEMSIGCLLVGKAFDTFCPLGPVIATDLDPDALLLEAFVNGERRQSIKTSDLLFSCATLVSYLSQAITLLPGDVIITGTPAGVGPVKPGDVVDITIEGIGTLTNPVEAER